ncbi:unnamed protein product [Meloidogyne enterolobii]|uniref:Uncharacterized protein n=1 Tax=Meloidogyne enterolobii TaxID=390850 RepID=A0ACB0YHH3_MELEN
MEYFVNKNSEMGEALINYKKNPNKNIDYIEVLNLNYKLITFKILLITEGLNENQSLD